MQPSFPQAEGVTHRFVRVNGLNWHLAEAGSGEPMLMLHGWPQHWYMWRYQIPYLAQHYAVICPDLRGFGWSDAPATGYEKEQLVDDIIALLDTLKLKRIRLMAHDWGGWVAFLLCLRQPDRVTLHSPNHTVMFIHGFYRITCWYTQDAATILPRHRNTLNDPSDFDQRPDTIVNNDEAKSPVNSLQAVENRLLSCGTP